MFSHTRLVGFGFEHSDTPQVCDDENVSVQKTIFYDASGLSGDLIFISYTMLSFIFMVITHKKAVCHIF